MSHVAPSWQPDLIFHCLEGAAAKGYHLWPFLTEEPGVALGCSGARQGHRDEEGHGGKISAPSKVSSSALESSCPSPTSCF